ncbi:MAG TPA: adenylate/guanylate cyclase domain-containing protein, partial [Rhizomicrobium sp.]|nr:adenylate/guanylate cyclase domain-containing protein [Rhizomicrobium sp.]
EAHHGRIFNTAGDAILAEFTSPVEAVRCATEIQAAVRTRNEQLPPNRQVRFRIGVNVGDVMVQNADLLGDGVNVAARLQGAAAPGGICISGSVYDQIRNKLTLGFEPLGERRFKNIPQPVRTFTIAGSDDHGELPSSKKPPGRTGLLVAVAALSLLLLSGGFWAYSVYRQGQTGQSALPQPAAPAAASVPSTLTPAAVKNPAPPAAAKEPAAAEIPSPPVPAATPSDLSRLMRSEEMSDNRCTDGSGDLDETGKACAERDRLVEVLADRGWCRGSQQGKSWQRCAR